MHSERRISVLICKAAEIGGGEVGHQGLVHKRLISLCAVNEESALKYQRLQGPCEGPGESLGLRSMVKDIRKNPGPLLFALRWNTLCDSDEQRLPS